MRTTEKLKAVAGSGVILGGIALGIYGAQQAIHEGSASSQDVKDCKASQTHCSAVEQDNRGMNIGDAELVFGGITVVAASLYIFEQVKPHLEAAGIHRLDTEHIKLLESREV